MKEMKRAIIIVAVWAGILGVIALNLQASEIEKTDKIPKSSIYQVSGRNELFLLEEGKWRYVSSMDIIYSLGYTEKDINKNTDIAFFCQYPIGYPVPGGWADPNEYGYVAHKDWYIGACQKIKVAPTPLPPPPEDVAIVGPRIFYGAPRYPGDVTKGTEAFRKLRSMGFNVASVNWRPPAHAATTWTWDMYGSVLEAAGRAGIQIIAWIGWQPEDIAGFMSRYAEDTNIYGWYSQEEPLIAGAPREWQQQCYDTIKAWDPYDRPVISAFSLSEDWQYDEYWQPSSFDIGAFFIYPYSYREKYGTPHEILLNAREFAPRYIKAGKKVIPGLAAFENPQGYWHGKPVSLIEQYQWWQQTGMPLVPGAFWAYPGGGYSLSEFSSRFGQEVTELCEMLGWTRPLTASPREVP